MRKAVPFDAEVEQARAGQAILRPVLKTLPENEEAQLGIGVDDIRCRIVALRDVDADEDQGRIILYDSNENWIR